MLNKIKHMFISQNKLSTVKDVIAAMANRQNKVAELLGVHPSMITRMIEDEYIPPGHHMRIEEFLERKGYKIDRNKVFGFCPIEEKEKCRRDSKLTNAA